MHFALIISLFISMNAFSTCAIATHSEDVHAHATSKEINLQQPSDKHPHKQGFYRKRTKTERAKRVENVGDEDKNAWNWGIRTFLVTTLSGIGLGSVAALGFVGAVIVSTLGAEIVPVVFVITGFLLLTEAIILSPLIIGTVIAFNE